MRGVLLLLLLSSIVATVYGDNSDGNQETPERGITPYSALSDFVEDTIIAVLENLRTNPSIYPSLDFEGRTREIINDGTKLNVSFRNVEVIGIPDFVTENVTYIDPPTSMVELTLSFDELIISGENYGIYGVIAGVLNMNGDGPFELRFGKANLNANAKATARIVPPSIVLEDLVADITIQSFTMEMVNIFGETDLTDEFNKMMSTIGIDILGLYKENIDLRAARYLEDLLNGLLPGGKHRQYSIELAQDAATDFFTEFVISAMEIMEEIVSEFYSQSL